MKKLLVLLIMVLYAYIAYPSHLIGNYQAPPKSQNNPSLPGFVVNPQECFFTQACYLKCKRCSHIPSAFLSFWYYPSAYRTKR
jgi:hypothetical protein